MVAKIHELPNNGQINSNEDAVKFLRLMADGIENNEWGNIKTLLLVVEHNSKVHTLVAGGGGLDNARCVGLLTIANHQFVQQL
jgi:hypothetical protein